MRRNDDRGYILVGVLMLLALGMAISAGMLDLTATGTKTRAIVRTQAEYQYECEETLNKTVAWLQANSKNIVGAFDGTNFSTNFDTGSPVVGANEGEHFGIPTMVKMKGTNNSVMLSNNAFFGEAAFPGTNNIDTNAAFDAQSAFATADLGKANARAVLMWARSTDGHYEPIFRVDAVTGNNPDRGAHMFTYVYSQINVTNGAPVGGVGIGFYTETDNFTTKNGNNQCYSYSWSHNGTSWSKGAPRSNCVVASKHEIILESKINGNVLTNLNGGVTIDKPSGEVSGTVCETAGCHNYTLNAFPTWDATCAAGHQGDLVISSNTALVSGAAANEQCWRDVTVNSNVTLTLNDKTNPYRFRNLTFQNNSNSKLAFVNMAPGEKVTVYVENFANGSFNGNQFVNTNNAPRNVEINVTGAIPFKLNGTADIYGHFVSPLAAIEVLGTFNFHGAIKTSKMDVTGTAKFNYDEGILTSVPGPTVVSDMKFTLKKASQRYR